MYEQEEDLYSVVFRNDDGTKTAYYYNHPVKYVDTDGSIKDITLEIEASETVSGAYESKDTVAQTVFSQKMTDGITLNGENVSIRLAPIFSDTSAEITPVTPGASVSSVSARTGTDSLIASPSAQLKDGKSVVYQYDSKTSYEYALTYTGFKEDIVVSEYTGQTEYTFILYTNGLTLVEDDAGEFYLCDASGKMKASIGSIIIFTADEQNNAFGSMTAQTIVENEQYIMTIHIDSDYLSDEKTKYPIRIDPTIELSYDINGEGGISDITINNAETVSGTSGSISAGKYGDDNSVSRILMKFPELDLSSVPSAGAITSATVYIRDVMCQHEYLTLDCYAFTGNTWSETDATWSNVSPDSIGTFLDTHEISYYTGVELEEAHYYDYDITAAVRGWKSNASTGAYIQEKGIIFKAASDHEVDTTHNYKTFASYNRANYKPYLVVIYNSTDTSITNGVYRIKNAENGMYLDIRGGGSTAGTAIQQWTEATSSNTIRNQLYKITLLGKYNGYNYYSIRPMTNSGMGVHSLYTTEGAATTIQEMSTAESWAVLPYTQCWAIAQSDVGYTIKNGPHLDDSYLTAPSNNTNGAQITTASVLSDSSKWILEPYTGEALYGVGTTHFSSTLAVGDVFDYDAYMYSSTIGINGPVTYRVGNNDYTATDKATINETTGELTALKSGAIKVGVSYEGAPWVWWWSIRITPYYGCKPYNEILSAENSNYSNMNCHGYALWSTESLRSNLWLSISNSDYEQVYNSNDMLEIIKPQFENWLDNYIGSTKWEDVTDSGGINADLANNQWLVVMRVGYQPSLNSVLNTTFDYHFWYRTDEGEWVNKHGYNSVSQQLGEDLPTDDDSIGWELIIPTYYDSDLVYYRITE